LTLSIAFGLKNNGEVCVRVGIVDCRLENIDEVCDGVEIIYFFLLTDCCTLNKLVGVYVYGGANKLVSVYVYGGANGLVGVYVYGGANKLVGVYVYGCANKLDYM
jgi:hypothetical protein